MHILSLFRLTSVNFSENYTSKRVPSITIRGGDPRAGKKTK